MIRTPIFAWLLLAIWASWLLAAQGRMGVWLAGFTPELGIVLLVALGARFTTTYLPAIALVIGLAHSALSIDPTVAILAQYACAVAVVRLARMVIQLERALLAALVCLCLGGCAVLWFDFVRHVRSDHLPALSDGVFLRATSVAIASGVASLLVGAWLAYLPGLSPLRRSSPWARRESQR